MRTLTAATPLLADTDESSPVLAQLGSGEVFDMLDNSRGWAWGYAGDRRLVGYVRSEAVSG